MKTSLLLLLFTSIPVLCSAQVDYASQIQPIFSSYCTSCHGGQNGVTLSSYEAVINSIGQQYGTNIVVPGDADASPLVDKISNSNPEYGVRMPQNGPPYLSPDQINLIVAWINEGASQTPVSNEIITQLPAGYRLLGNFPNPFNPSTHILFETPAPVSYTISVFSVQGLLVQEYTGKAQTGPVSVELNLSALPSGVYLYRLTAQHNQHLYRIGSGKMTLIK